MAAQLLVSRSLAGRRCRSSLPGVISRHFSTNPELETSDGGGGKRHPQSFVNHDVNPLELGELELNLPPGYHDMIHRRQRGIPKPRHDGDGKSSYWRPPWKNPRPEIISAEDFENRPRVTFSESFASLHDAMTVLSWMPQADKDGMYDLYVQMMLATAAANPSGKKKGKDLADEDWGVLSANTSHEYVVRVVAQEFNVTTSRAAGVIQLRHNEEQLKKDPTFKVNHLLQERVDAKIRENIRKVYEDYGEKDPLGFVEEPVAATENIERENAGSPDFLSASELTDVDALIRKTRMMELEDHRMRIRNHIYIEDVDERTRKVKVDQEAKRLMRMQEDMGALYEDFVDEQHEGEGGEKGEVAAKEATDDGEEGRDDASEVGEDVASEGKKKQAMKKLRIKIPKNLHIPPKPAAASPFPEGGRGYNEEAHTRRPRWKYAAQIINTHSMENPPDSNRRGRAVAKRAKGRRHGRIVDGNTIVEEGGNLRVASVDELEHTSWKHVRNESEFVFKGAKQAWMRRQLEGEVDGWGYQEEVLTEKQRKKRKGGPAKPREPRWHESLSESVQGLLVEKGMRTTAYWGGGKVRVSVGDARIKLGDGGYASVAHAGGMLAEGTFSCDAAGNVTLSWDRCLVHDKDGGEWKGSNVKPELPAAFCLADANTPTAGAKALWGKIPNPEAALRENGFKMRRLVNVFGPEKRYRKTQEPQWHESLSESVHGLLAEKGIKAADWGNAPRVSVGDARIKLGGGGYAAVAHADGTLAEGTFSCDAEGNVTFSWDRCLVHDKDDGEWKGSDVKPELPAAICLADANVSAVGAEETTETLWGDLPDPVAALEENGFQMRNVVRNCLGGERS